MASHTKLPAITISFLYILFFALPTTSLGEQCDAKSSGGCNDKDGALKFKIIAIVSILITSMIGVSLPLVSRSVPAFKPDKELFLVVKAFASGVILATGYMHVLPDSFDCLRSECLPENPWRKFPFTTFVAMLSALFTLMVDSFAMSYYRKYMHKAAAVGQGDNKVETGNVEEWGHGGHGDMGKVEEGSNDKGSTLMRYRVVAQVY